MENQNNYPSNDSSSHNKSPPSSELPPSDETHASNSTTNDEGPLMKTPWQVLQELGGSSGDDDGGDVGGSFGGGGPVAVAVAVDGGGGGGSTVAVVEGVVGVPVSEKTMQVKKRKTPVVRDPPSGKPICPICNKEFASWKAAFGHMRAHPNREYRGFFKPPVFNEPPNEGESGKKSSGEDKEKESTPVQMLAFDLNEPLPVEEGESSDGAEPAQKKSDEEEGKGVGFDLNEIPSAEDYDA